MYEQILQLQANIKVSEPGGGFLGITGHVEQRHIDDSFVFPLHAVADVLFASVILSVAQQVLGNLDQRFDELGLCGISDSHGSKGALLDILRDFSSIQRRATLGGIEIANETSFVPVNRNLKRSMFGWEDAQSDFEVGKFSPCRRSTRVLERPCSFKAPRFEVLLQFLQQSISSADALNAFCSNVFHRDRYIFHKFFEFSPGYRSF